MNEQGVCWGILVASVASFAILVRNAFLLNYIATELAKRIAVELHKILQQDKVLRKQAKSPPREPPPTDSNLI